METVAGSSGQVALCGGGEAGMEGHAAVPSNDQQRDKRGGEAPPQLVARVKESTGKLAGLAILKPPLFSAENSALPYQTIGMGLVQGEMNTRDLMVVVVAAIGLTIFTSNAR